MKVYLVRHGDALSKIQDETQPLSDKGNNDVVKVSKFLKNNHDIGHVKIFHSEKLRAKQTATIIANSLKLQKQLIESKDLKPNDEPDVILAEINLSVKNTIYVGHMPFMDKLVSLMVMGDYGHHLVEFETGTVVCLQKGLNDKWIIEWIIRPENL